MIELEKFWSPSLSRELTRVLRWLSWREMMIFSELEWQLLSWWRWLWSRRGWEEVE
jgi:hypothetical protein